MPARCEDWYGVVVTCRARKVASLVPRIRWQKNIVAVALQLQRERSGQRLDGATLSWRGERGIVSVRGAHKRPCGASEPPRPDVNAPQ